MAGAAASDIALAAVDCTVCSCGVMADGGRAGAVRATTNGSDPPAAGTATATPALHFSGGASGATCAAIGSGWVFLNEGGRGERVGAVALGLIRYARVRDGHPCERRLRAKQKLSPAKQIFDASAAEQAKSRAAGSSGEMGRDAVGNMTRASG